MNRCFVLAYQSIFPSVAVALLSRVIGPEVRWNLHSGDDDLHLRIFRAHSIYDRLNVRFQRGDCQTAQTIVSTELNHEHIDFSLK